MAGQLHKPKLKAARETSDSQKAGPVVYGTIDHGWAWIIMFAMALWNALIAGTLKSFGVIYLEFLDLYERGPVATAWLGFSFSFLTTVLAPVSGYIGDQVSLRSQRQIVMVLAVLTTVAIAVTGSMPSLEGAIVTYGLAGVAVAVIDTPILSLIGKYFRRRRFLASGVVSAGSSFGTLVLPPMITALVREYSIRGAMMVFGAIWLNTVVIGAVIRPLKPCASPEVTEADQDDEFPAKNNMDENTNEITTLTNGNSSKHRDQDLLYQQLQTSTVSLDVMPNGMGTFLGCSNLSLDKQLIQKRRLQCSVYSSSVPSSPHSRPKLKNNRKYESAHHINLEYDDKVDAELSDNDVKMHPDRSRSDSELCGDCHPQPMSIGKKLLQIISGYWQFLTSPGLPLLTVTLCVASFAYFNQFFLLPPLGQEVGMSRMNGALLVSISNGTELFSRLIIGVLIDKKKVQKSHLVKANFVLAGAACFAVSFYPQTVVLYVYAVVFGMIGGIFCPLAIPLMVELVKETHIASATGIFVLVTGTGISLGPPILGAVRAWSGSYANCFRVCSVCYGVALIIYLFQNKDIPLCCKRKEKHEPTTNLQEEIA